MKDYLLSHFHRLFPQAAAIPVAYGMEEIATNIRIRKYKGNFFQQLLPHPPHVVWKEWQGRQVPFFFEEDAEQELISYTNGIATINYDLIASGFYLLSGWQEYHSTSQDKFGRYPYSESVQARHGFITKPVVNYYFGILQEAIDKTNSIKLQQPLWTGKASFATCLTHDIDRLHSAWKVAGIPLLKQGQLLPFLRLALAKLKGKDAWNNIPQLMAFAEEHRLKATYFWMANQQKFKGHSNADYAITPATQAILATLQEAGHEVGMHGGFGTSTSAQQLKQETEKLGATVQGNRFHYLCHSPQTTPQVLEESGLSYDSTLGFAEHFGFRHSYCHPFHPFDFKNRRAHRYTELPLILMDTTLYGPNYLHLRPQEVLPLVLPLLQEIKAFGGLFTLLWHNENLSDFPELPLLPGEQQWRQVLHQILAEANAQGSCFLTCSQAAQAFTSKA